MGSMEHHAILLTSWHDEHIKTARAKAVEILESCFKADPVAKDGGQLVSPVVSGLVNSQYSFFIAPDGSKEGWETSNIGDQARRLLMEWLDNSGLYIEYALVRFGGDGECGEVMRTNYSK